MKNFIKILTVIMVSAVPFSCGNFLDESPDNRVELDNLQKAALLLTNAYSTAGYTFTEWMTDNVSYTFGTRIFPEHDQAYTWSEFTGATDDQDTPNFFWHATYSAIAHSNEVLLRLNSFDGTREEKEAVRGEALLTRAYGHFMLVNLFAKHYNKETADDDPGIPYVTEPETVFIKQYERQSVEDVYDAIEEDLTDGLRYVNNSFYQNSGKYHFSRNAALAFASRFYLFKGEWENCIKYSNQLLQSSPDIFVKDIVTLRREAINPDDYIRQFHAPSDPSNLLLMRQISNFHIPSYGHWLEEGDYDVLFSNHYGLEDMRSNPAWIAGDNGLALAKFEMFFERTSLTSNVGYNYTIFIPFRGEEVLFNRAESYIQMNQVENALADLLRIAKKRYADSNGNAVNLTLTIGDLKQAYGNGPDQSVAFTYLMHERIKEFMHEGLRWFDLKRYEIPVTHQLPNGSIITLEENDLRKVLQIPAAAIEVGGLEPNPR